MAKLQRIDTLTEPPVVGRLYLVPTIIGEWFGMDRRWVVMGELHDDRQFFDFPRKHYHLDRRFLALSSEWVEAAETAPLCVMQGERIAWRIRKCRSRHQYFPAHLETVTAFQHAMVGTQCRRNEAGWICPHRGLSLGSVPANGRGIITCPMHGLMIGAATGVVAPAQFPTDPGR